MKQTKITNFIEYLSPTLILLYFFIHNIFLVFIAIFFSLYLININFIHSITRSVNKKLVLKKESTGLNQINSSNKIRSTNINLSKNDPELTLVETIEELGFIPSINKDENIDAV